MALGPVYVVPLYHNVVPSMLLHSDLLGYLDTTASKEYQSYVRTCVVRRKYTPVPGTSTSSIANRTDFNLGELRYSSSLVYPLNRRLTVKMLHVTTCKCLLSVRVVMMVSLCVGKSKCYTIWQQRWLPFFVALSGLVWSLSRKQSNATPSNSASVLPSSLSINSIFE